MDLPCRLVCLPQPGSTEGGGEDGTPFTVAYLIPE